MNELMEQIKKKDARSFTHGGKFHADDVFSAALLFYINPEITILRGNRVPDDFDGIVFDIGRSKCMTYTLSLEVFVSDFPPYL